MLSVTMGCLLPRMTETMTKYDMNCAVWSNGGWWHSGCQNSCLNGLYGDDRYGQGVNWEDWRTLKYSLKSSVMKVRKPL